MAKSMLAAVQEAVFGKATHSTESELAHKPVANSHSPLSTALANGPVASSPISFSQAITSNDRILAEWTADSALQAEFRTFASYRAWRQHEDARRTGKRISAVKAETPKVEGYVAGIERNGTLLTAQEKAAIRKHADTWRRSEDIRTEFGSFSAFASYMRAKDAGRCRIFGQ